MDDKNQAGVWREVQNRDPERFKWGSSGQKEK